MKKQLKKLNLVVKSTKLNNKSKILAILGLALAISIPATMLIYNESHKADYYQDLYNKLDFPDELIYRFDAHDVLYSKVDTKELQNLLYEDIKEHDLTDLILNHSKLSSYQKLRNEISFSNQSYGERLVSFDFNSSLLHNCKPASYIPTAWNEILLYCNTSSVPYQINQEFNISCRINKAQPVFFNRSFKITGIITPETIRSNSSLNWILGDLKTPTDQSFLTTGKTVITKSSVFSQLLQQMDQHLIEDPTLTRRDFFRFTGKIRFQLNKTIITKHNAFNLLKPLEHYFYVTRNIYTEYVDIHLTDNYAYQFNAYQDQNKAYDHVLSTSLISCLPLVVLSLYVAHFSLKILNTRREQIILLYRIRGVSKKFIVAYLVLDTVLIGLLSWVLGLIGGLSLTIVLDALQDFGLLKFTFTSWTDIVSLTLSSTTILTTLAVSIIFIILANGKTIWTLSTKRVANRKQSHFPNIEAQTSNPNSNYNIDIFLLIQGTLGLWIVAYLLKLGKKAGSENITNFLFPLLGIFVILAPFSFLLGTILFLNRYISSLIGKLSHFFWKRNWKLPAFAGKSLTVDFDMTKVTSILITLSISFIIILSIFPVSFQYNAEREAYYEVGCEIRLDFDAEIEHDTLNAIKTQINEIQGLNALNITYFLGKTINKSFVDFPRLHYRLLSIPENFTSVSYWHENFAQQPQAKLIQTLYRSNQTNPVIISEKIANNLDKTINDTYMFEEGEEEEFTITIVGICEYWPGYISEYYSHSLDSQTLDYQLYQKLPFMIFREDAMEELTASHSPNYAIIPMLWCSFSSNLSMNQQETRDLLDQILMNHLGSDYQYLLNIKVAQELYQLNSDNPVDSAIIKVTNLYYIGTSLVMIVVMIIYSLTKLNSKKQELTLSRSLGMKFQQIFSMSLYKYLLLFTTSGLPGLCLGAILLYVYWNFFLSVTSNPFILPFLFIVDWNNLSLILGCIFFAFIGLSCGTAYHLIQLNISNILKADE